MKLINHMEGETVASSLPLSKLDPSQNDKETVKLFLENFMISSKNDAMAIKENQNVQNKYIYSVPVKPPLSYAKSRAKAIDDAKKTFLKSSSNTNFPPFKNNLNLANENDTLHYAQIAVTTSSEDSRSTGGGKEDYPKINYIDLNKCDKLENKTIINLQNKLDTQQRKVSFKIKNAACHRRPPLATKTMTITSNKVSELTQKFNNLVHESHGPLKTSQIVKTIEDLQAASQRSTSNSSTPSSTLSSSPNIKIVFRHRRGSKKRYPKTRCSSADSIDKIKTNLNEKIRVNRSKSDGTKKSRSPRKQLKYQNPYKQKNSLDLVDGVVNETNKSETLLDSNVVKNTIKKFECEITAQNLTSTLTRKKTPATPIINNDKPKVPEKKVSLVVTKNIVLKDGIPKIKSIKCNHNDSPKVNLPNDLSEQVFGKKKEVIYDKNKFRTNYIHTDKLPLHLVDIIHEDFDEISPTVTPTGNNGNVSNTNKCESKNHEINTSITPNESFLWRRKSSTQIYSDSEKSFTEGHYSILNETSDTSFPESQVDNQQTLDETTQNDVFYEKEQSIKKIEAATEDSDFESNLVETFNKEVLVGFTSKPEKQQSVEDDYEPLEPFQAINHLVIESNMIIAEAEKPLSKLNCPLPDIPKEVIEESRGSSKTNIYQCLLEMRSHPEGDESSHHSYELCENEMEERTRGDGDSDDGYEYCKNVIKPYCHISSTGIHIAEYSSRKNYVISKSVSGISTDSYEKIGSERIYETIPLKEEKDKSVSPTSCSSHQSADSANYNDGENIYDTIKHADGVSLSHCYESIPNSPSTVKLRNNFKRQLMSAVQKRLSFDQESNISRSTVSSEQKTNSIYGQRSMLSYNGQEMNYPVPNSDASGSDRSDDWVDVSDEEKYDEQKIVIVTNRGRKSPISWSQKVRHQRHIVPNNFESDNSESGHHLYESLEPPPIEDDFDSFDSDTDDEPCLKTTPIPPISRLADLPDPPVGGGAPYTLTKIASVAQRKMRELKRNLTKRYSVVIDGKSLNKLSSTQTNGDTKPKTKNDIYSNGERTPPTSPIYSNINFNDKPEPPIIKINGFKEELERRLSSPYGEVTEKSQERSQDKPLTPTSETKIKDNGTLSRKTYFSFKSRFKRANSVAVDINTDIPSALKITNSTFYLNDSMDGDSGFSNCSDSTQQPPVRPARQGSSLRRPGSESAPCLARPPVPPPPPPTDRDELKRLLPSLSRKEKSPRTRTSWYAECSDDPTQLPSPRQSSTSWYAEAGLYQAGNISSSSGASSGSHPASPLPHSLFTHEPLYQFYNAAKVESTCRGAGDSDSDAYEVQGSVSSSQSEGPAGRPSAMALVTPARGPARTLWCEVPEVVNSAVLSSLAPTQKRLQEAKFEILTSEASYLNSLSVLETQFMSHPAFRDPHQLSKDDRDLLFEAILPVRKCSQLLMNELEKCWQENILLQGLCDIIRKHALQHFHVYIKYCEVQSLMVKALQRLREDPQFALTLRKLEAHPACQSLSLHSFLMLPMQRVTRLPLLMDAVLRNLNKADDEYQSCMDALATLNNFVCACNEGARNTERVEEMYRLSRVIEFPPHIHNAPVIGPALSRRDRKAVRWLVRSGPMTQTVWRDDNRLTFGRKAQKVPLYVFLFCDLLVITKKKSEEKYVAVEVCARSLVECSGGEERSLLVTLLENHHHRTVEMMMSCESQTDAARWAEALRPPASPDGNDAVYAGWDCPQVAALWAYTPAQPDEMTLHRGDVINVARKTAEGWYYGERIRDGETGWFPGSYTAEIASPHVRARNLRLRYRLLGLSATYLGHKRKANA